VYMITLHDDADFGVHIQELEKVISVENARVSDGVRGDSKAALVSYFRCEVFKNNGLPFYSGTFSNAVLRWIRAREEVKLVEQTQLDC
jgi:hypothetical protein